MATGIPPSSLMMSAWVPETLSSIPFRSARDLTGVLVMMFAGGQVNRVRILTPSNSLALYLSMRS